MREGAHEKGAKEVAFLRVKPPTKGVVALNVTESLVCHCVESNSSKNVVPVIKDNFRPGQTRFILPSETLWSTAISAKPTEFVWYSSRVRNLNWSESSPHFLGSDMASAKFGTSRTPSTYWLTAG